MYKHRTWYVLLNFIYFVFIAFQVATSTMLALDRGQTQKEGYVGFDNIVVYGVVGS